MLLRMVSIPQSVNVKLDGCSPMASCSVSTVPDASMVGNQRRHPQFRSKRIAKFVQKALLGIAIFSCSCVALYGQGISGLASSGAPPVVPLPQNPHALPLSAASEATLQSLAAIESLPAETWRVHDGDLPHGEAPDLDDSAWQVVQGPYLGKTGPMWFRRTIVVPPNLHGYDLTGANIRFAFDIWAEGPVPIIIYFDGRRVAMGEAMEPISLFTNAHPGDKISIAVKALDSADAKHFRAANLAIDFAKDRPDPRTFRLEALSATYLLPALLGPASESKPELIKDQGIVEAAIASVHMAELASGQQQFDASLRAAEAKLEPLRPLLSQAKIHLTGNAHIDAAWVWPWTETVDSVRRTFGTALQLMREYPNYTYSQSASAYYEWMEEKYPPIHREIASQIKQGRWEAVGGMWVEPDLNLLDGESIVRQLLVGTRYLKQKYGASVHVGWNPDTFGYTWQLPQIYKKSGIDYFVTQKMGWNESNLLPLKLFYWQSPDGSRVLSYFPHDYNNPIEPDKLAADFNVARRQNPGLPDMMHLYGVGDHGGGPTRTMLDIGNLWMQPNKTFASMQYGTALSYFNEVEPKLEAAKAPVWNYASLAEGKGQLPSPAAGKIAVPVWNDELYLEYTRGVYTTEATQKRNMRESEEWMLDAEKWSALNYFMGASYPAAPLNEAWKKVLFNQFHDIAGGSGVTVLYKDAQRDYDNAHLVAMDALNHAIDGLGSYIQTAPAKETAAGSESVPVIVWNSLAWQRTDVVQADILLPSGEKTIEIVDNKGRIVLSQAGSNKAEGAKAHVSFLAEDVPALGYAVFYARPAKTTPSGKPALDVKEQGDSVTLRNQFLTVTVDRHSGCITSLVTNSDGFDSIAAKGCGNQLEAFKDTPSDYDAWNIDPGTLDHFTALPPVDSADLVEKGPLCATVRTKRSWQHSKFQQDIQLCAGIDHADISNEVDWHEQHVLLKAAFPLAASSAMATYEIPYGSIERPTTRKNRWDAAKFEVPALRWADLGDADHGFSLINEAKYGYDAKDNVLRLTLLRSSTAPDPVADQGAQHFAFSLYPHHANWKQAQTVHRGYEFNYKLYAEQAPEHPGTLPASFSFVSVDSQNLTLTALKKSEDGQHLVLRFYEWAGKSGVAKVSVPHGIVSATSINLMEEPEGPSIEVKDGMALVPYTPYSIVTVRLDCPKVDVESLPTIAEAK